MSKQVHFAYCSLLNKLYLVSNLKIRPASLFWSGSLRLSGLSCRLLLLLLLFLLSFCVNDRSSRILLRLLLLLLLLLLLFVFPFLALLLLFALLLVLLFRLVCLLLLLFLLLFNSGALVNDCAGARRRCYLALALLLMRLFCHRRLLLILLPPWWILCLRFFLFLLQSRRDMFHLLSSLINCWCRGSDWFRRCCDRGFCDWCGSLSWWWDILFCLFRNENLGIKLKWSSDCGLLLNRHRWLSDIRWREI